MTYLAIIIFFVAVWLTLEVLTPRPEGNTSAWAKPVVAALAWAVALGLAMSAMGAKFF